MESQLVAPWNRRRSNSSPLLGVFDCHFWLYLAMWDIQRRLSSLLPGWACQCKWRGLRFFNCRLNVYGLIVLSPFPWWSYRSRFTCLPRSCFTLTKGVCLGAILSQHSPVAFLPFPSGYNSSWGTGRLYSWGCGWSASNWKCPQCSHFPWQELDNSLSGVHPQVSWFSWIQIK